MISSSYLNKFIFLVIFSAVLALNLAFAEEEAIDKVVKDSEKLPD